MSTELVPMGSLITEIRNGLNCEQYETASNASMLPISRIETISYGTVDFARVNYVNVSYAERHKYQLQPGDILFSHINSPEHIGKTAIFRSDRPLIHGINLLLLRPDPAVCHPEYLNYYLKSFGPRATFRSRCKKAVNQASLNQGDVTSLLVPRLSLPEQKRIATILEKADRLCRLRRYTLELSDSYLQSVFLRMFGDPVANPKGWKERPLDETVTKDKFAIVDGPFGSDLKADEYTNAGVRVIKVNNIKPNKFNFDDVCYVSLTKYQSIKRSTVRPGNVVMAKVGNTIGKTCVFPDSIQYAVLTANVCKMTLNTQIALPWFISYQMNFDGIQQRIRGLSGDTAKPMINIPRLRELKLILPDIPKQQEYVDIVLRHKRLQVQQREAERQSGHLFQTLMHRAFREQLTAE